MSKRINVLVPMYNSSKTIVKCINSIQKQTYDNFDIIVMDDGSRDDSYQLVKELADTDKRIRLYKKSNQGYVAITRNKLLEKVDGDYFIFVDSDDVVSPLYLEILMKAITETGSDISCCEFTIFKLLLDKGNKMKNLRTLKGKEALGELILGAKGHFMVWNKLINATLIKNIKFNEHLHFGEDFVFTFDLFKESNLQIALVDNKLYYYKLVNQGISKGGLTPKKQEFLDNLIEMEQNSKYEGDREILSCWIYVTCGLYLFLTSFSKKYKNYRPFLKQEMTRRKKKFIDEKRTRVAYRFLLKFIIV